MADRLSIDRLQAALGWFISCFEDVDYPAYTGPGDPHEGGNPRQEMIAELRQQTGIDLTDHVAVLIAASDTAEHTAGGTTTVKPIGEPCSVCGGSGHSNRGLVDMTGPNPYDPER